MKIYFSITNPLLSTLMLIFCVAGSLVGQTIPTHLGAKNPFPIGNHNVPARIFALFLQENASHESLHFWQSSKYYDSAFISTTQDLKTNLNACIKREGESPNYHYSVIPGHEESIIDAVNSSQVQQEFQNYLSAALSTLTQADSKFCDYINDKIAARIDSSYAEKAQKFDFSNIAIFVPESRFLEIEQTVDQLVDLIYAQNPDEAWIVNAILKNWNLALSTGEDNSLPAGVPKHVVQGETTPSTIENALQWPAKGMAMELAKAEDGTQTLAINGEKMLLENGRIILTKSNLKTRSLDRFISNKIFIPIDARFSVRMSSVDTDEKVSPYYTMEHSQIYRRKEFIDLSSDSRSLWDSYITQEGDEVQNSYEDEGSIVMVASSNMARGYYFKTTKTTVTSHQWNFTPVNFGSTLLLFREGRGVGFICKTENHYFAPVEQPILDDAFDITIVK